jgi:hypothetical protein
MGISGGGEGERGGDTSGSGTRVTSLGVSVFVAPSSSGTSGDDSTGEATASSVASTPANGGKARSSVKRLANGA